MTSCRPTNDDVDRTVLLPLGQTVQHQPQAPVMESNPTFKALHGHCGVKEVVEVTPISHGGHDAHHVPAPVLPAGQQAGQEYGASREQGLANAGYNLGEAGLYQRTEDGASATVSQRPMEAPHSNSSPVKAMNPDAQIFHVRDPGLVHQGRLVPDLDRDWTHVQHIQAGDVVDSGNPACDLWKGSSAVLTTDSAESDLPFQHVDNLPDVLGLAPKQVEKVNRLVDMVVQTPSGEFIDKILPRPEQGLATNEKFTPDYFIALHNITAAPGI